MTATTSALPAGSSHSARELFRHRRSRLLELPAVLLAWLLAFVPGWLWPRRRELVLVIGRGTGQFSDNAKYFYMQGLAQGREVCFLSGDAGTCSALQQLGAPCARFPSAAAVRLLLRAGTVVADSAEWVRGGRFQLAWGARRIQLWHGVPLKMIELADLARRLGKMPPLRRVLYRIYLALFSRYPRYDVVVSTSPDLTRAAFGASFRAGQVVESGYPRNDVLDAGARAQLGPLVWVNTDAAVVEQVRRRRSEGARVMLYAPTFRTHGRNPVDGAVIDYRALDDFARAQRLLVVLKLHPLLRGGARIAGLDHVLEYDAGCDVYPLLAETDLLVSDYSSIYFDYLLLDRPLVFFAYDLEEYRRRERDLVFPFEEMAPGPVAMSQAQLQDAVAAVVNGADAYRERRAAVRAVAFGDQRGGAAARLWAALDGRTGAGP